jgi:hypothetical protein
VDLLKIRPAIFAGVADTGTILRRNVAECRGFRQFPVQFIWPNRLDVVDTYAPALENISSFSDNLLTFHRVF